MFKKLYISVMLVMFIVAPSLASAHERQVFNIGGVDYLFVVGSLGEPVVVDDKTGIDLRVKIADPKDPTNASAVNAKPVEGLEKMLKVELIAGDKRRTMDISPAYKDPGVYKNIFFPTVKTSFSYRFMGTINNTPVDLLFTCAPEGSVAIEDKSAVPVSNGVIRTYKNGKFGCPMGKEELGFPEESSSIYNLQQNTRNEMINMMSEVKKNAENNQPMVALILGVIAVVLSGIALRKVQSRKP